MKFWKKRKTVCNSQELIDATRLTPCKSCNSEVLMYYRENMAWVDGCHIYVPPLEAKHHLESKRKCQKTYEYVNRYLRILPKKEKTDA